MKTIILCGFLAALALVFVPPERSVAKQTEDVVLLIEEPAAASALSAAPSADEPEARTVQLKTEDGVETVDEDTYLTAVVLSEMPASFEPEALAAQAVAARTFLARQRLAGKHMDCDVCADSACCQAWSSEATLDAKYGVELPQYWDKASAAVAETAGEILTYDGAPIEAVYFSCSGGSTEAAVAVWGTDVPYLQAVESPGEQDALRYESEAAFLEDELRAILNKAAPEAKLDGPSEGWFGEPILTEGGGVASVTIGGEDFTGTQLRSLLGLNSTRFTVTCGDGEVVFHVRGFGHRVGMSQYGANAMAKLGFDYRAILQYYYRGAVSGRSLRRIVSRFYSRFRTKVRIRNAAPVHLVARASLASRPLPLFFDRKLSPLPPPMAEERPALLPDWIVTIATSATARITWITVKTICRAVIIPPNYSRPSSARRHAEIIFLHSKQNDTTFCPELQEIFKRF